METSTLKVMEYLVAQASRRYIMKVHSAHTAFAGCVLRTN